MNHSELFGARVSISPVSRTVGSCAVCGERAATWRVDALSVHNGDATYSFVCDRHTFAGGVKAMRMFADMLERQGQERSA